MSEKSYLWQNHLSIAFLKHIFFLLVLHLSLFCVTILNMIIPNGENYIGKTQHSRLLPYIGR